MRAGCRGGRRHRRHRRRVDAPGRCAVSRGGIARVIPIVEKIARETSASRSTRCSPAVMRAALDAGASMINDVRRCRRRARSRPSGESECAVCLMHMQGEPATMQHAPRYDDVVAEVAAFLRGRASACRRRPASRASASWSIPASASARRSRIISRCSRHLARSSDAAIRCWPACRASRRSARSPGGRRRAAGRQPRGGACRGRSAARDTACARRHAKRVDALAVWRAIEPVHGSATSMTNGTMNDPFSAAALLRHRRHARPRRRGARSRPISS